jgi:hypothetical protein
MLVHLSVMLCSREARATALSRILLSCVALLGPTSPSCAALVFLRFHCYALNGLTRSATVTCLLYFFPVEVMEDVYLVTSGYDIFNCNVNFCRCRYQVDPESCILYLPRACPVERNTFAFGTVSIRNVHSVRDRALTYTEPVLLRLFKAHWVLFLQHALTLKKTHFSYTMPTRIK